jgi:hypothetical protein
MEETIQKQNKEIQKLKEEKTKPNEKIKED